MKLTTVDSLASVEALMALEEQLEGPLANRIPTLKAFLVKPFEAQCSHGGTNFRIWVVAQKRNAVLFASLETASFGVGMLADVAQVVESQHYPAIDIAANSFLRANKEAA